MTVPRMEAPPSARSEMRPYDLRFWSKQRHVGRKPSRGDTIRTDEIPAYTVHTAASYTVHSTASERPPSEY